MKRQQCPAPIPATTLADYWSAFLPADEEMGIEEHLLGCSGCSAELEWIVSLAACIRELARMGAMQLVVSAEFLDRLRLEGLRVRQYSLAPEGHVNCTVTAEDDLLVARLSADLAGAKRIDLVQYDASGREMNRLEDVPFNEGRGEIILSERVGYVRTLPSHVMKMKMIAVEDGAERLLANYTFNHTASR